MECANWSGAVYADLLQRSDGTGESMLTNFFSTVGWPLSVETSEQSTFVRKVHAMKQEALRELLRTDEVPLR